MGLRQSPDEASSARRYVVGGLWGVSAAAIWAGWMVFTRLGLRTEMSPHDITAIRFGTAGLLLLPVVTREGLAVGRLGWGGLAVIVAGAGAPYALVAASGLVFAPAAHAGALIPGLMPVFVACLSLVVLRERIAWARRVGLGLIIVGVTILVGSQVVTSAPRVTLGHVLFLTAALMWACFTVTMRQAGLTPLHAAAIVATVSMVLYLPIYGLAFGPRFLSAPYGDVLVQALYQGVLTSCVSLLAYGRAVAMLGASRGATFGALVPVLSLVLAIPVLGETPSAQELAGVVSISIGVLLATGVTSRLDPPPPGARNP